MAKNAKVADATPAADTSAVHNVDIVIPSSFATEYGGFRLDAQQIATLPTASLTYLLGYGFNKALQDAASGTAKAMRELHTKVTSGTATADEQSEAAEAMAYAKLSGTMFDHTAEAFAKAVATADMAERFDAIVKGTLGARGTRGPRIDPLTKMVRDVADERIAAALAKANAKAKAAGAEPVVLPGNGKGKDYAEYRDRYIAKNRELVEAEARRRIDSATAEADELDV